MIEKNVSRGVAGIVGVSGFAMGAVMGNVASLPKESRVKFVKGVVFAVALFLAAISAVVSLGLFNELNQVPAADKELALSAAIAFAMPAFGVAAVLLRKLLSK